MKKPYPKKDLLCLGSTSRGKPCKLRPEKKSKYCHFHNSKFIRKREQKLIKNFFQKHKQGIFGFLGGSISDPIANDIYDFIKELVGMKHLVPLIPESNIEQLGESFRRDKNLISYFKILPSLVGITKAEVLRLLGIPKLTEPYYYDNGKYCDRYYYFTDDSSVSLILTFHDISNRVIGIEFETVEDPIGLSWQVAE